MKFLTENEKFCKKFYLGGLHKETMLTYNDIS